MKIKENYQSLLLLALLIFAGTVSPSNGVDDKINKTPWELISTMLVMVLAAVLVNFVWSKINTNKISQAVNPQSTKENTLTSN